MKRLTRRDAVGLIAAACAVLVVPKAALADAAVCSWHAWQLSLTNKKVSSPSKYFDGNNIGLEMTCSSSISGTICVECIPEEGGSLGVRYYPYKGFKKNTWKSNGSGQYHFCFYKSGNDVSTVTSSDVAMYSW